MSENKIAIEVEEVCRLKARLREINALDLKDIVWTEEGTPVEVPAKWVEEWRFTGMNNADFIDTDFYKDGLEHMIVCQSWHLLENGQISPASSHSLHADNAAHKAYTDEHMAMIKGSKDERGDCLVRYHIPHGDAYNVAVSPEEFEALEAAGKNRWVEGTPPEPVRW